MEIKVCKDCKWSKFNYSWVCLNPKIKQQINIVTGALIPNYCEAERHIPESCGIEGKLWEAKDANA